MCGHTRRSTRIVCQIVLVALLVQALLPTTLPAGAVTPPPEPQLVLGLSLTPESASPGDLVMTFVA
jgi:hypothetical protein